MTPWQTLFLCSQTADFRTKFRMSNHWCKWFLLRMQTHSQDKLPHRWKRFPPPPKARSKMWQSGRVIKTGFQNCLVQPTRFRPIKRKRWTGGVPQRSQEKERHLKHKILIKSTASQQFWRKKEIQASRHAMGKTKVFGTDENCQTSFQSTMILIQSIAFWKRLQESGTVYSRETWAQLAVRNLR